MEESNKLFVFEKKEVVLIFIFIVLIAVISFTLGVRTGKGLSLKEDKFTSEDINKIELKSVDEEFVDEAVEQKVEVDAEVPAKEGVNKVDDQVEMEKRLREEMEKLASEDTKVVAPAPTIKVEEKTEVVETKTAEQDVYNSKKDFKGKYTIQLYSNQSEEAAKEFADGFIVKGFDVIVNEVILAGKGKWYRVSIGVFENVNDAKEYLDKEKKLFQENKYLIQQF